MADDLPGDLPLVGVIVALGLDEDLEPWGDLGGLVGLCFGDVAFALGFGLFFSLEDVVGGLTSNTVGSKGEEMGSLRPRVVLVKCGVRYLSLSILSLG